MKRGLKVGFIPEWRFATSESIGDSAIAVGDRVVLLGYPLDIVEGRDALPLAKGGTLATPPERDFRGLPMFLIDAPLIRGSSGSPVIAPLNQMKLNARTYPQNFRTDRSVTPTLLGIHSSTVTDWELIVKRTVYLDTQESMSVVEGAGFGIAFRAETISQAIDETGWKRYKP